MPLRENRDGDISFEEYEAMCHSRWKLPGEVNAPEWIRKYASANFFYRLHSGTCEEPAEDDQ